MEGKAACHTWHLSHYLLLEHPFLETYYVLGPVLCAGHDTKAGEVLYRAVMANL